MKHFMKISIIAMLMSISAMCFAQQDTVQLDTITPNQQSRDIIKQLTEQLAQIEQARQEATQKLMILITAIVDDPKKVTGFTDDYKILTKK